MSTEGAICAQYVKCGKPGCKCSRGELHGPYYYQFTREGRRLRKTYVRKAAAADALAAQAGLRELKSLLGPSSRRRARQSFIDRVSRRMDKVFGR